NRDLLRGNGPDIQPHGRVYPFERGARDALLLEFANHVEHLVFAADHGDVACRRGNGEFEHPHIVAVAARRDDDVAGLVDRQFRENLFVLGGVDFVSLGKAFAAGEGIAVIDDDAGEAGQRGHLGEAFRNVTRAENEGVRHRQYGLDEDIQLAAADQAVVVGGVLSQVEGEVLGFFRLDYLPGRIPDFGLHAAAANRARHGPVFANQELGALITGDGPAHLDDGGERALLPQIAETHQFLVNVHSMNDYIVWRKALPCASERSSDLEIGHLRLQSWRDRFRWTFSPR